MWEIATAKTVHEFKGHTDRVDRVVLSPDGRRLVTCQLDGPPRVWDPTTRKALGTLDTKTPQPMRAAAFMPDSRRVVLGGYGTNRRTLGVWDLAGRREVAAREFEDEVHAVAVFREGKQIIAGIGARLHLIDVDSLATIRTIDRDDDGYSMRDVIPLPDGRHAITGGMAGAVYKNIKRWDLQTGQQVCARGFSSGCDAAVLAPDGKHLLSAGASHTLRLRDPLTFKELARLDGHTRSIWGLAISGDGKLGLSCSDDGTARVWRLPVALTPPKPDNYALEFAGRAGEKHEVRIESLKLGASSPVTYEAWVVPHAVGISKNEDGSCIVGGSYTGLGSAIAISPRGRWRFFQTFRHEDKDKRRIAVESKEPARLGERVHVAGVWDRRELRLYVEGKLQGKTTGLSDQCTISKEGVWIGDWAGGGGPFQGQIDEVRISNVARYDKDFVPAQQFELDANTLGLYHFDEGAGEVLRDASANARDGKIVGAKWVESTASVAVDEYTTLSNGWKVGKRVRLGPGVNSSEYLESAPSESTDGLTLLFASDRPGGFGHHDVWMSTRTKRSDPWSDAVNLGPTINNSFHAGGPSLSRDGLTLVFDSTPGGGPSCLFLSTRRSTKDPWGKPVKLNSPIDGPGREASPCLSADGLTLIFTSDRPGGRGDYDLYQATRPGKAEAFGEPVNLGPKVNTPGREGGTCLSTDGLALVFSSPRTPGSKQSDVWMATRPSVGAPWGEKVNLGPQVNGVRTDDWGPWLSADGRALYFTSNRGGSVDVYRVPLLPPEPKPEPAVKEE